MGDNFDWYLQSIVNYTSSNRTINLQMCPFSNMLPRNKNLQALWRARSYDCSFIEFLFQLIEKYEYPVQASSISFPFWTDNSSFYANLRKRCPFMTNLSLKFCKISDKGLQIIKKAQWKFITKVDFTCNLITSQGAITISSCNWKYITVFILNQNQIKNKGFKYILQAKWTHLNTLSLYENGFTSHFWKLFVKHNWSQLNKLVIFQEKLKYGMVRSFLQILPKLQSRNLYRVYLQNPGLTYCSSLDKKQINKFFLNNTAKLKRNKEKLALIIDMDQSYNEVLSMMKESGLVTFQFL